MFSATTSTTPAQAAAIELLHRQLGAADLLSFVPLATPAYDAPHHLKPLIDLFEEALTQHGVRAVTSVPPQHGKSETLFHLLVLALLRDPTKRHLYGTYGIDFAQDQARVARRIAHEVALPLVRDTDSEWRTPEGGGILWTGRGGRLTGRPVDGVAIVDDPIKNWTEANSPTIRDRADAFVREVIQRLHPGASIILNATRWHQNDPSGRYIERGWRHVNMPAISPDGEPLWPERRPLWFLERQRADVDEHDWHALFMGNPRPREGALVRIVPTYEELPDPQTHPTFQTGVGFDGAYTSGSRSDWTVALKGRAYPQRAGPPIIYVTDAIRMRAEAADVIDALTAAGMRRVTWRRAGTEKGMVAFMRDRGIHVREVNASTDKLAAARAMLNDLRRGLIRFPTDAPWMPDIEAELLAYTGSPADRHDDVIDALGALHDELVLYRGPDVEAARRASGL